MKKSAAQQYSPSMENYFQQFISVSEMIKDLTSN